MKVDEFYDMLPVEFWNKVTGFHELENMRQRQSWERSRWSTCILVNMQMTKGKRLKPKDLILFDWEKEEINNKVDIETLKNNAELFRKKYNKLEDKLKEM
tara:strand:- start:152 stop:451 length:300 start_codon:yes stop_codon:yes gene_type:complete